MPGLPVTRMATELAALSLLYVFLASVSPLRGRKGMGTPKGKRDTWPYDHLTQTQEPGLPRPIGTSMGVSIGLPAASYRVGLAPRLPTPENLDRLDS